MTRRIRDVGIRSLEEAGVAVEVWPGPEDAGPSRDEVLDGIQRCDVLVSLLTEPIDRAILESAPQLRGVANYAVGFDNIDIESASELGIPVSNTPGVLTDTTADLAWALLLSAARNIPQGDLYMRGGKYKLWGPNLLLGEDISGGSDGRSKILGLIGFGRIGQAVAKRARGFDMKVVAFDPYLRDTIERSLDAQWAELNDLLERSDFISIHTLLTDETRHLIGAKELERMKPTAFLINTARGPIVDESALVEALRHKSIAGAGLDVFENEPAMADGLAELDNVVLLPHLGSATKGTRDRMASMTAANALAMLRREPAPNVVNPGVYESAAYAERVGT